LQSNNDLETIVGIWTGKPRKLYRIIIVHFMLSFIVYSSFYKGLNWFTCIIEFSAYTGGQAKVKGNSPPWKKAYKFFKRWRKLLFEFPLCRYSSIFRNRTTSPSASINPCLHNYWHTWWVVRAIDSVV